MAEGESDMFGRGDGAEPGARTPRTPELTRGHRSEHVDPEALMAEAEKAVKGKYRIEHLAGTGGMSRVFSARQAETGRHVAVKLLRVRDPSPQLDPTLRLHHRLVNEARSMSRLDHPNLCKVLEVSIQGDIPFLVMEWADGVDLEVAWAKHDRRQRLSLFLKIVDAIAAAHAGGVVHGDLKPDNILVDRRGEPTIVDFGLARSERDGPMGLATSGGTPGYAPPECFEGQAEVTPASDVFSLGVMLFRLLTDHTPWPDDMAPALLVEQMRRSDPPLPEQFVPDTPPDLQRICLAALERKSENRYASAEQMAADLRRSLRRETVTARPTMLVRRFDAQVRRTIDSTREWLRLGLVTPESAGAMLARLNSMARADTPWVADARRVSWSQATLQAGGAVTVVAVFVGVVLSGTTGSALAVRLAAFGLVLALTVLGVWLARAGQARIAAGMLWAAFLAAPATAWLVVDRLVTLGGTHVVPESILGPIGAFLGSTLTGPTDAQMTVIAGVATLWAVLGRWAARTSAFTLAAFVSVFATWVSLGSVMNAAPLPIMTLLFGAGSLALGLSLDWDEQRTERESGAVRGRARDARAVLGAASLCVSIGAASGALLMPGAIWGVASGPGAMESGWGAGLLVGAAIPAFLAYVVAQRVTPMRALVGAVARGQTALQALAGVALLEYGAVLGTPIGPGPMWFWALLLGALLAGFIGVRMKWRVVLFVGHASLALWTVRLLAEAPTPTAALVRAGIAVGGGLVLMLLAWRLPIWRERRRLRRWAKRRRLHNGEPPSASWG
ncbi:MAG: serine/threonine-protein kinase [Planctomycetota bacterium]